MCGRTDWSEFDDFEEEQDMETSEETEGIDVTAEFTIPVEIIETVDA